MFQNKWKLSFVFLLLSIFIIPFYCVLPEDPHDPSNAKMSIILLGSDGKQSTTFIADSTGKTIEIGMAIFLPQFIDSFNLKIGSPGNLDTLDTTIIPTATTTTDTLWKSFVFSTPGIKTVTITPYSQFNPEPVEVNITVYERVLPANNKPSITVSGNRNFVPGTIGRLTVAATDPDTMQALTVSLSGNPAASYLIGDSLFIWESPETFSGGTTVLFIVTDNGIPPLSDTEKVTITVSSDTSDTTAPVMTLVAPAKDSGFSPSPTYTVDVICGDASGVASVTATVNGTTVSATTPDGHYAMSVSGLAPDVYTAITITATDSSARANKRTRIVYVKYSAGFSLVYSGNGSTHGTVPVDTAKYQAGAQVTVKANTGSLVKIGSTFAGWNTAADGGGTTYDAGSSFVLGTENDTLFAKWSTKPTYALMIDATNGSVTKIPDRAMYDSGTVVTLTPIPATGYHFTAWNGALSGTTNPATVTMNGAKSVTAEFAKNQTNSFALTVLASNGTVKKTPDLPQYDSGSTVDLKATPGAGFNFVNWSGDATGTADSTTVVMSAAKNITANFVAITYQLTVSVGTGGGGTISTPTTPATVNHGAATTITASPNSGFRFTGWSVTAGSAIIADSSSASTSVALSSGNATVTAGFTRITYQLTVTSETGGVISTPSSPATVNHSDATTVTASPNSGYIFNGWVVTAGNPAISDLTTATTTVTLTRGDVAIRAQWTAIPYSITYSLNGGQQAGGVYPATFTVNTADITLPSPAKTAYVFDGWYNDSSFSGNTVTSISAGSTGNKTLFAKWAIKDRDGNYYTEVKIGNQYWMVENFRCTKYNDGTAIEHVIDSVRWMGMSSGAYCFYENSTDTVFRKKFGALYNGYSVTSGKLAPVGWRVPSGKDWDTLVEYLAAGGYSYDGIVGNTGISKALAAQTDWATSTDEGAPGNNLGQNNRSGFSALPGGIGYPGRFIYKNSFAAWWIFSSDVTDLFCRFTYNYLSVLWGGHSDVLDGISVRLVHD